jgi:transposase InsO family protein
MHMTILRTLLQLQANPTPPRQGAAGQLPRRALEHQVRQRAVQCADRLTAAGCSTGEAAGRLGVNERTLRLWRETLRADQPLPLLGRPLLQPLTIQQQAVTSVLDSVGPGIGVPTLRPHFPDLTRAALDDLVKSYRRQWRADNLRTLHVLKWQRPGTVWAIDFAEVCRRIDGRFRFLLAVRDLASGQQLLWQPVDAPTAAIVRAELALLFAMHGAPWILKTDNGSAFIADNLRWYLHRSGVYQLFSPPRTPAYNGSIEASIGSLKNRTQQHCERAGHPGLWTSADVEAAHLDANTARPRRLHGLTPDQVWQARSPLSAQDHASFQSTVEQFRIEARREQGLPEHEPLTRVQQALVDRSALRRALVAHDLLLFRRRRIPPRITRPKTAIEW